MLFVKHNKLKCQNLVSFVSAGIIILFIGTSSLSNAQTPIPEIGGTVNHHLSGTLQNDLDNIKKVEKDINDKKNAITSLENKPVESDPQFVADVAAYNKAKKSSDDFFTSNNNKYPTNSPEFSTASAQQKSLDAAANDARAKATLAYTEADSAKKAQIKNLAKELAGLQATEMRSLNELNGILKAGQVLGNLQDNSCLGMFANKTTADIGNMPVGDISACLNHVFDGMELSNKNEFQNQGNGTNFFGISLSTHTGKVQIYQGLPVMSPAESALKTAAWDYVFKHPEANTRDKQYSLYENYLNEHANNKGGASLPMVIHVLGEKNTGNPKSIDHIEVPMPSTEKPASTQLEEFGSSVQTIILKLKQYLMQSSTRNEIHVRVPTSVAAVRG